MIYIYWLLGIVVWVILGYIGAIVTLNAMDYAVFKAYPEFGHGIRKGWKYIFRPYVGNPTADKTDNIEDLIKFGIFVPIFFVFFGVLMFVVSILCSFITMRTAIVGSIKYAFTKENK